MAGLLSRLTESSLYDWRGANAITLITCLYRGQVQPFKQHSAFFFLSSLPLSCGGSMLPLLWWQVPSEVFNHLSCKTPFNWNYPLADKLLEPYREGDIVVRIFHAGGFCSCLLLLLFFSLSFSSQLRSVHFPPQNGWSFFPLYYSFLLLLYFFQVWKLPSQASCRWCCCCSFVACNTLHEPVRTLPLNWRKRTYEPLWHASPVVSCESKKVNAALAKVTILVCL